MKTNTELARSRILRSALVEQTGLIGVLALFGLFVNILFLTGPLFVLQVYDRVLSSRSEETLVVLAGQATFLILIMGLLDHVRRRIAARIGERIATRLERPVFDAVVHRNINPIDDQETIRRFFGSALFVALFDLSWLPVFIAAIAFFHPLLRWLSLSGAVAIFLPGLIRLVFGSLSDNHHPDGRDWAQLATSDRGQSFGLDAENTVYHYWQTMQHSARYSALRHQDMVAAAASITPTTRLLLQSAMIALGAYLVLQDQLTAGAIIATSVLLWRALASLDLVGQNVGTLHGMLLAWRRLALQLESQKQAITTSHRIGQVSEIRIENLTVFPPGTRRAALRAVSFDVMPGQAIGIIGASDSGKTTLANALIGNWPIAGGNLQLGGVSVDRIRTNDLHAQVGYLPQVIRFHDGSIEDNITGFALNADPRAITPAAMRAGAHASIIGLSDGYQTQITSTVTSLSGGFAQRLGLARALYGDPSLLVLDEPANNLDPEGLQILHNVVLSTCAAGGSAVVLSQHRASLSACEMKSFLSDGHLISEPLPIQNQQVSLRALSRAQNMGIAG